MEILRMITAGSVDDGKSTLIGRLLFDSKQLLKDQVSNLERLSKKRGLSYIDFSLLTDGLKDEIEQGITIDIAYRYFTTGNRKYILADTPGHVEYTRNYVTAASGANLAVLLVDARKGVTEQTRRHAFIASVMGIRHLVFCINKMDLVEYSEAVFQQIKDDITSLLPKLEVYDVRFIPISALHGDNVVSHSENMPWYEEGSLLSTLENIHISSDRNLIDGRFPVQAVIRVNNDKVRDYRGFSGQIASGIFRPGDEIIVLPSGTTSGISKIYLADRELNEAMPPMSVTMTIEDDIDISRGSIIAKKNNKPVLATEFDAIVCWLDRSEMDMRKSYLLKSMAMESKVAVKEVLYTIDINTYSKLEDACNDLKTNDIGRVKCAAQRPVALDIYRNNRSTGCFILIDEKTNNTVAACIVHAINT